MDLKDVINVLISSSVRHSTYAVPHPVTTENERILLHNDTGRVYLIPVMHTNEIELILEIGDTRYSQDALQSWLGEPIHAYMFSEATIQSAAKAIIETVGKIFERLEGGAVPAVNELEIANDRLSEESMRTWIREQANEAWESCRYNEAVELYTRLGRDLSRVEEKRLEIARQRCESR